MPQTSSRRRRAVSWLVPAVLHALPPAADQVADLPALPQIHYLRAWAIRPDNQRQQARFEPVGFRGRSGGPAVQVFMEAHQRSAWGHRQAAAHHI